MFTKENLIQALIIYQAKIETAKAYLCQLDTPIGDGDHGENMSYGMSVVIDRLEAKNPSTLIDVFKNVSLALLSYSGGACGTLYSTAMMEMANEAALTNEALPLLEAGLVGIERRGNSQPGEKTMVDVWAPALAALKTDQLTKEQLVEFTENTKDIFARKGRASYVGARSLGHIDPGAMSSRYLFEAFIEAGIL